MEENTNVMANEETVRNDLIDQMNEFEENESFDPAETSENDVGSKIMIAGGSLTGLALIGVGVVKGVKFIKSGKAKEWVNDGKAHLQVKKDERAAIKKIKAEGKEKIKAIRHPMVETKTEVSPEPAAEVKETKKTSNKK